MSFSSPDSHHFIIYINHCNRRLKDAQQPDKPEAVEGQHEMFRRVRAHAKQANDRRPVKSPAEGLLTLLEPSARKWRKVFHAEPGPVAAQIIRAVEQVARKKNPKQLNRVRFESYDEGRAAQVMYVGPYSNEGPAIERLHAFIDEQGGSLEGTDLHHHEIYLNDPRRTDPLKLKTVIRQPY